MFIPLEWKDKIKGNKKLLERLNALNAKMQDLIFKGGKYYIHTFTIPDLENVFGCDEAILTPLRYMGGNPLTTKKDVDGLLNYIRFLYKE